MKKSEIVQIIKEEIGGYEYLNQGGMNQEQNQLSLLNSKDFQTRLIQDTIDGRVQWQLDTGNQPEVSTSDWGDSVEESIDLEWFLNTVYNYNGQEIPLHLDLEGSNIPISKDKFDDPFVPQYYDSVDIQISTSDGEVLNNTWLNDDKTLNKKKKEEFLRKILGRMPEN